VEVARLRDMLATAQATCPQKLRGTPFDGLSAEQALALPLPALEYDFYPAPSGERIVLVRHQHVLVPRCETIIPERVGTSTVSVLSADGGERVLFPFPQHGTIPPSEDWYAESEPDPWQVYLAEVVWAPDERHIAFGNNDRPGVMTAAAVRTYLNRFAVLPGENIIIATNNDSAYEGAVELSSAGAKVTLLDARSAISDGRQRWRRGHGVGKVTVGRRHRHLWSRGR